jgi:anti-sigma factor RsiW
MTSKPSDDDTMACAEPGAVTPEDLLLHATDGAGEQVAAHLAICPACRAQVQTYASLDKTMASHLFRADCPPAMTLGELALDLLPPEEAVPARAHLALCPHCTAELSLLSAIGRTDPLLDERPSALRRILARLVPASALRQGALALRGVEDTGTSTYSADDVSVVLSVGLESTGPPRRWSLVGLVVDQSGTDVPIVGTGRLSRGAEAIAEAPVDENDGITFSGLPKGVYALEIVLGDRVVVVSDVRVGDG